MTATHILLMTSILSVAMLAPVPADSIEVAGRSLSWEPSGRLQRITNFEEAIGAADRIRGLEGAERAAELVALYGEAWEAGVRDTSLGQNTRSAVLAEILREGEPVSTTGTLLMLHASRDASGFYNHFAASQLWRGSKDLEQEIQDELLRHWSEGMEFGRKAEYVSFSAYASLTQRFPAVALSLVPEALERLDSGAVRDSGALASLILSALPPGEALDLIEQRAMASGSEEEVERNRNFLFGIVALQHEGKLSDPAMRERVWQVCANALASDSVKIRATALYTINLWHDELVQSGETVPVPESFIAAVERCNRNPGDEERTHAEASLAYWRQHRAAP